MTLPATMNRQDFWELIVHDWTHCVRAGVRPVVTNAFPSDDPKYYRPVSIMFEFPPTRKAFLRVVEMTPWMQTWNNDFLPVVAKNPWPMIDNAHKAAHVDLVAVVLGELDTNGTKVGRLEVVRREMYLNGRYHAPFITHELVMSAARLPKSKRDAAWQYIEKRRYEIMERVVDASAAKGLSKVVDVHVPISFTNEEVALEIRRFLVEGGFLKKV